MMTSVKETFDRSDIEPGRILLLWREGSYDGMVTGIGLLDGQPVYLDASEQMGSWNLKPRWRELETLIDDLLDEEDAENIWDRIERKYDEKMNENQPRIFDIRQLTPDLFAKQRHRQWQLHAGLHSDFLYKDGKPMSPAPRYQDEIYWHNSQEYLKAHWYDVRQTRHYPAFALTKTETLPLLGRISWKDLFAKSEHQPDFPKDPRPAALKAYQATWKPGDPVRLDWD